MTQITCDNCAGKYTPSEAHSITIYEPGTARYVCPKCLRGTDDLPPQQPVSENLPGIDHIEHTLEDDWTTATCWFTNDARLRFRETSDGWLREEVLRPNGEEYESRAVGQVDVDDGQTACHCLVETLAEYETYTISELRLNWPHVASVLGP
jgi:hypothetical protein